MASDLSTFDCYAVTPRSHAYDTGDYGSALKELEPLASDECPQARRLLAVMYAKGQGVPLTNPLILKDSKTPEFLIPTHDDVANRAGRRACASRSIGWNWFMIF